MKFYVTDRSSNYEKVKEVVEYIKKSRNKVTFEWTALPMVKPYSENSDKAAEYAEAAIQGVVDADVYIIFVHQDGNGVFAEFGAALAMQTATGKPRIMAVGEQNLDWAMFYAHSSIEWFTDIEAVFNKLNLQY